MKFGKELSSQMVQEWQEAYIDYRRLKKLLKRIFKFRQQRSLQSSHRKDGFLQRKLTLYRSFSGLTGRDSYSRRVEDDVILINPVQLDGSENGGHKYQTVFLKPSEEGGEYEIHFFKTLDHEFNKVLRFYNAKVEEVKSQALELSKQMDTLIALRIKVDKPWIQLNVTTDEDAAFDLEDRKPSPLATETGSVNVSQEDAAAKDVIQEVGVGTHSIPADELRAERCDKNVLLPAALSSLARVKINIEPDSPVTTLKSLLASTRKSELSFSKEELRQAEEKLLRAFIEFYQQLGLLKSYRVSNIQGFSKIMKKYDKITSRNASKSYIDMVENSYLGSSDEVNKLIERVEVTFIKHFSNGNRRKGMKLLKPVNKMEQHRTTFFLGIFTGGTVALLAGVVVSIHARRLLQHEGREQYMNNIFPLYSLFGFIFLHMFTYGISTYLWRQYRVNYPFIFEFKPGTELGFREIFLLASGLSVLTLAAVLSNLDMEMDPRTQRFQTFTELVPAVLVTVLLLITFCPINIIYRSSRYFLIRCAWRCIYAPFYKVTFADFFLADQLTSQVQAFRNLEFYICYYGWGDFKRRSNRCLESNIYKIMYIVVAVIPFWLRFLQCLRRLFEEKDLKQGVNSLKYFSTIVAVVFRTIYDFRRGMLWKIMAGTSSGITAIFNTYWDIVVDWGLLQRKAKYPWLRDKLLVSNRLVYFAAIISNILLRLVWMQLVLDFHEAPFLHRRAMVALVACLEILRRGIWNFFRFNMTCTVILHHASKSEFYVPFFSLQITELQPLCRIISPRIAQTPGRALQHLHPSNL